tara:strand:+ start:168 stop:524 length:357 start_codon:yes stop_codon:yes gene_type:complete
MAQHNSFKNDIDLISEAYGSMLGGAHMGGFGLANQAADQLAQDDGFENAEDAENKTGDMSDADLLKHARTSDGNLKPEARDALSKLYGKHSDEEGHGDKPEDGEGHHGGDKPEDEAYM